MTYFDPTLRELFSPTPSEWQFTNDIQSDLSIMKYNNNPYAKFSDLPGFDQLADFVQKKLQGSSVYSKSEIDGWTRFEFQTDRAIAMFGSDTIFVPPGDKDLLFYKALEKWFEGLPYGTEENPEPDSFDPTSDLNDYKQYGLTQSLLEIFDK